MLNLAVLLEESARRYGLREAFIHQNQRLTYAQVNAAANQVANVLTDLGVKPGFKIALTCPNLPIFPQVYFGILKTGAVLVPLNIMLKHAEIAYHLRDSQAAFFLCAQDLPGLPMCTEGYAAFREVDGCRNFLVINLTADTASPLQGIRSLGRLMEGRSAAFETIQTHADDSAVILYTSGTTGQPKGAELSHFNMFYNAVICRDLLGTRAHDIQLIVLPLFHSMAQTVMMNSGLYAGASAVLMPRFDPLAALETMEKEKVTIFGGVPTMYWAILHSLEAHAVNIQKIKKNLRICGSGGASMSANIKERFENIFETQILEGYGLSETSPAVCFTHRNQKWKAGSIGTPVWGVEVKIADAQDRAVPTGDAGELLVRGHNVMKGYYRQPEATAQVMRSGWFHSGDIARMDEEGYIFLLDRLKDMINRGGQNIYPREVEDVLLTHPAIAQAAVIGVPDEAFGEEVKAFVVLKEGADLNADQIIQWTKEQMASFKHPRQVEICPSLPLNAAGKILKKELRGRK